MNDPIRINDFAAFVGSCATTADGRTWTRQWKFSNVLGWVRRWCCDEERVSSDGIAIAALDFSTWQLNEIGVLGCSLTTQDTTPRPPETGGIDMRGPL